MTDGVESQAAAHYLLLSRALPLHTMYQCFTNSMAALQLQLYLTVTAPCLLLSMPGH
jgi:hypothetical protein